MLLAILYSVSLLLIPFIMSVSSVLYLIGLVALLIITIGLVLGLLNIGFMGIILILVYLGAILVVLVHSVLLTGVSLKNDWFSFVFVFLLIGGLFISVYLLFGSRNVLSLLVHDGLRIRLGTYLFNTAWDWILMMGVLLLVGLVVGMRGRLFGTDLFWHTISFSIGTDTSISVGLVILVTAGFSGILLLVGFLFGGNPGNRVQSSSYECGFDAFGVVNGGHAVGFEAYGVAFLVFDVEIVVLFPAIGVIWSPLSNAIIIEFITELGIGILWLLILARQVTV